MSDDQRRELETRWRQTGAVEDEAALLRDRVRTGELDAARVRLAAMLGDAAAGGAVGDEPVSLADPEERAALLGALVDLGRPVAARAVLALAGANARGRLRSDLATLPAPAAVIAWAREPTEARLQAMRAALHPLYARATVSAREDLFWEAGLLALPEQTETHQNVFRRLAEAFETGGRLYPEQTTERLLRDALVPWLLGYEDPLA